MGHSENFLVDREDAHVVVPLQKGAAGREMKEWVRWEGVGKPKIAEVLLKLVSQTLYESISV